MKPWKPFALTVPPKGGIGSGSRLRKVMHVTHTLAALRIMEDKRVVRGLIHDESALNAHRTTVTWLSPNHWHWGSRYGNVEFTFEFEAIAAGRSVYWVESIDKYKPTACRFLITDKEVSHLPVTAYDPDTANGPLQRIDGEWWWNSNITLEVMFEGNLDLAQCCGLDFVKHNANMCATDFNTCTEKGDNGDRAAARVVAGILSRHLNIVDHLLVNGKGSDVSMAMGQGLARIPSMLGALNNQLDGPLTEKASVDAVVHAALSLLSHGDQTGTKASITLVGSDDLVIQSLNRLCKAHLGITSKILTEIE